MVGGEPADNRRRDEEGTQGAAAVNVTGRAVWLVRVWQRAITARGDRERGQDSLSSRMALRAVS